MHNLAIFYTDVTTSFKERKATSAIFLDIKSAYDNVLSDILLDRLSRMGFPPHTIAYIQNLTSVRQLNCCYDLIEERRWTYKGLSQGRVLSPLLYTLYIMDLDSSCLTGCKILQYADDVVLYFSDYPVTAGLACVESSLESVSDILT